MGVELLEFIINSYLYNTCASINNIIAFSFLGKKQMSGVFETTS